MSAKKTTTTTRTKTAEQMKRQAARQTASVEKKAELEILTMAFVGYEHKARQLVRDMNFVGSRINHLLGVRATAAATSRRGRPVGSKNKSSK